MKALLVVIVSLVTIQNIWSQTAPFTQKREVFLTELRARMDETGDKKASKEFTESYTLFWNSPDLTDSRKDEIIATLNKLIVKKAIPTPDLETYLVTYRSFIENKHDTASFNAWHKALCDLIAKPRYPLRNINQFMNLSRDLIENNVIYSTSALKWVCKTKDYKYRYDGKLKIIVGKCRLVCFSQNDSIEVLDTEGEFAIADEMWTGKYGRLTWERASFSADEVMANFKRYQIKMDKPYFHVDSAIFYNKQFFKDPLKGYIDHKVTNIKSAEDASYPKFVSYEQRYKIDNIHPNMFYEGGFAQYGAKFLGAGTDANPAQISIFRNDTLFVTARSLYFGLRRDQITSTDTEIKIHLDSAYIYHPGLMFKYMVKENELHLIRNGEGMSKSPYFNTYHNVSMDVELLRWRLNESTVDLKMLSGAAENYAFFESLSYYREEFYNQLKGMDAIHPLQGLKNCSKYFHGQPFTAADYAKFLGMMESPVRQQVMSLSFFGFIGYNVNTDMIEIRDRLNDYLLFRLGKKDYDVIRFASATPGQQPNAQLDLKNYDLHLNGVSTISICDHQNVVFFPRSQQIILKQNRNFMFDGTINSGLLNLFGDGFKFSYENFRIDIKTIDSMRMQVQTGELDYFGKPKLAYVNNTIAQLSGYLQIDKPNNKSGSVINPGFPILTSTKESYVYFEKPEIQNNAYKHDKFYFTLDTFSLDSINSLSKRNFRFNGTFTSGIMPDFREKLTVREDFSLGFKRQTPPGGFPIYGGKAKFNNTIDLSNKGLYGDGIINYLVSESKSENFLFLPARVTGIAHEFTVAKQTQGVVYPDVQGKYIKLDYKPYDDLMVLKSQEENFNMYNKEAQLNGSIALAPTGLTGKGTFSMLHGSVESPAIMFADHSLVADSSNFNLQTKDVEGISFATTNLISTIDFEKRMGTFVSKTGGSKVEFTDNKYISFIREFSWDMDKNYIYMGAKGSKGNRFVSVHKKQDSLEFQAPIARYDVALKLIEAQDVKNIRVADANIWLKNGIIRVRESAVMDQLDSTTISLNDSLHVLHNAKVNIEGKYLYSGRGMYDFYNGDNKKETIDIKEFKLNDNLNTVGQGTIEADDYFTFNKHFTFKGGVTLNAADTLLTFDGGAQMLHKCLGGPQAYIRFEGKIDPNKVRIPIEEDLIDFERQNLYKDFFMKKDSVHIYSAFIGGRKNYSDIPIISGEGYLTYNEGIKAFEMASMAKLNRPDTTGTVMRYSEIDCNVYGDGTLNMGIDIEPMITKAYGTIMHKVDNNDINLSTLFATDFFFVDKITELMVADINASKAKASDLSAATFTKRMAEWAGNAAARKMQAERTGSVVTKEIPAEQQVMLNFGNIDWRWNTATSSYIANGPADLIFIKNYIINKKVNIKAELMRKRSGNSIDIYIEFDPNVWYFFSFKAGMMQTLSSNASYNSAVQLLKPEERKMKSGMGSKPFSFIMAPDSKKNRFVKRIDSGAGAVAEDEEQEEEQPEEQPDKKKDKE
jgi:hypothetical protein